jgi:ATP-dependent DNA helicase DinG
MPDLSPETIAALFDPGGPVAERLPGFEERPGQVRMAVEVARSLTEGQCLMAEGGTGVGKSLAYLAPAVFFSLERESPVVVSTHTISLQEQLIERDIPLLGDALEPAFRAVLVKGRGNYLCVRRLVALTSGELTLLSSLAEMEELELIARWAQDTRDGSLSDLGRVLTSGIWSLVRSESGCCAGRKCPFSSRCFVGAARRRMIGAQILVVNHALYLSDLAVRMESGELLPAHAAVVIDEAHSLERAADDNLGTDISNFGVRRLLDRLYNPRAKKGLFAAEDSGTLQKAVSATRKVSDEFFGAVKDWARESPEPAVRIREGDFVENPLTGALRDLLKKARGRIDGSSESSFSAELRGTCERLGDTAERIARVVSAADSSHAFWVDRRGRDGRVVALRSAPVRAGDLLGEHLFGALHASVLTSATLTTGGSEPFAYFTDRLGVPSPRCEVFPSPFDFEQQVTLVLARSMPDPRSPEFPAAVTARVRTHLERSGGRAFVLFTSWSLLRHVAAELEDFFAGQDYSVFVQGAGLPRTALLEKFRREVDSVLLGTASFWEGVDVRGESLSNVIITRLPFSVPNHPLMEARVERIEEAGGNPFLELTVPEAVIRLKQGFGRLVRTTRDTGTVVILDRRIATKSYGRAFLDALPRCRVEYE